MEITACNIIGEKLTSEGEEARNYQKLRNKNQKSLIVFILPFQLDLCGWGKGHPDLSLMYSSAPALPRVLSTSELSGPLQTPPQADTSDQESVLVLPQISCAVLDRKVSVCLSFSICKIRMMLHGFTGTATFLLKKQSVTFGWMVVMSCLPYL